DPREGYPPQVAMLRIGETGKRRVRRVPFVELKSAVNRIGGHSSGKKLAFRQRRQRFARDLVAGEDEQAAPCAKGFFQPGSVRIRELPYVRQHDGPETIQPRKPLT